MGVQFAYSSKYDVDLNAPPIWNVGLNVDKLSNAKMNQRVITEAFLLPDLLNVFTHMLHANGLLSEWVTTCRLNLLDVAKVLGQCGHLWGLSPV